MDVISDKQGADIVMLDLRSVSIISDYFVICSAETERQLKAIVDAIQERTGKAGLDPLHVEGVPESGWIVLDYGSVVVHLFAPEERDYYRLEDLWRGASLVVRIQ